MTISRETVRDALATLLTTALVGTGKPAEAVYNYRIADFGKKKTVVTVSGAGSERPRFTNQGNRATFYLYVHVFVLYADAAQSWTEANAEDQLDLVEKTVAETVEIHRAGNKGGDSWASLDYAERTNVVDLDLTEYGGNEYRVELIPLVFEVFG